MARDVEGKESNLARLRPAERSDRFIRLAREAECEICGPITVGYQRGLGTSDTVVLVVALVVPGDGDGANSGAAGGCRRTEVRGSVGYKVTKAGAGRREIGSRSGRVSETGAHRLPGGHVAMKLQHGHVSEHAVMAALWRGCLA